MHQQMMRKSRIDAARIDAARIDAVLIDAVLDVVEDAVLNAGEKESTHA